MDFGADNTFSREYLQTLHKNYKLQILKNILLDVYRREIEPIAKNGGTCYEFVNFITKGNTGLYHSKCVPTVEEFTQGFQTMFPGCKVEYFETWEETKPGIRQQKRYILIDWS